MKRKTNEQLSNGSSKKRALSQDGSNDVVSRFRQGLFDKAVLDKHEKAYAESEPYKHGVIHNLIDDSLLRSVRNEILKHLHFTPKETDIYKIHQSGDLANLDGLEDSALSKLPYLLKLRDALYSEKFRDFISQVANSGPLSGKKTDMAINVYTPGCHLLCHDDVIGSRRVSYILYLPDPDKPWKPEWGGALRLYPTEKMTDGSDGTEALVPSSEFSVVIPPSFNQLSFFTIQPGRSFHDVEEVHERDSADGTTDEDDGGRVRMAISGWFHIPQAGERGYEPGLEEKLAEKSSLSQLQSSKADRFDLPQAKWRHISQPALSRDEDDNPDWTEKELDWLLKYVNPSYLVPLTVEQLAETFQDESVITLTDFLNDKFAESLKTYITQLEIKKTSTNGTFPLPTSVTGKEDDEKDITGTARPPHKHRFTYRHAHPVSSSFPSQDAANGGAQSPTPLDRVLDEFLPSQLFARWLSLFTGLTLKRSNVMARRFRRGQDYTLATAYEEEDPLLEVVLGLTPTGGWGSDENDDEDDDKEQPAEEKDEKKADEKEVGGYEVYMVGEDESDSEAEEDGPQASASHTGAGPRRKSTKSDPAIYQAQDDDDDDSGVLFANPASWNVLSVVLRDKGLLRFVKYVSQSAKGDRWDIAGNFEVDNSE
jgi:prolyl 3-hydroxylase /prolyl 3,4-dihydroxylase